MQKKREYGLIKVFFYQILASLVILGTVLGLPKLLPSMQGFSDIISEALSYNIEELGTKTEDIGNNIIDDTANLIFETEPTEA